MMLLFSQDIPTPLCLSGEVESEPGGLAAVPAQPAIPCGFGQPLHVAVTSLGLGLPISNIARLDHC